MGKRNSNFSAEALKMSRMADKRREYMDAVRRYGGEGYSMDDSDVLAQAWSAATPEGKFLRRFVTKAANPYNEGASMKPEDKKGKPVLGLKAVGDKHAGKKAVLKWKPRFNTVGVEEVWSVGDDGKLARDATHVPRTVSMRGRLNGSAYKSSWLKKNGWESEEAFMNRPWKDVADDFKEMREDFYADWARGIEGKSGDFPGIESMPVEWRPGGAYGVDLTEKYAPGQSFTREDREAFAKHDAERADAGELSGGLSESAKASQKAYQEFLEKKRKEKAEAEVAESSEEAEAGEAPAEGAPEEAPVEEAPAAPKLDPALLEQIKALGAEERAALLEQLSGGAGGTVSDKYLKEIERKFSNDLPYGPRLKDFTEKMFPDSASWKEFKKTLKHVGVFPCRFSPEDEGMHARVWHTLCRIADGAPAGGSVGVGRLAQYVGGAGGQSQGQSSVDVAYGAGGSSSGAKESSGRSGKPGFLEWLRNQFSREGRVRNQNELWGEGRGEEHFGTGE